VLDHSVFWGGIDDNEVWKELDGLLRQRWNHPEGGQLKIDACCVDAADGGHMNSVLSFCRARSGRRVMATKGVAGFSRRPLEASKSKIKGGRLWLVGSDSIKSRIYNQLTRGRMIRFSNTLSPTFYEQLCSERVIIRMVGGKPTKRFERIKGMDAEALDATVYAIAAKSSLQLTAAAFDQRVHDLKTPQANPEKPVLKYAQSKYWLPAGELGDSDRW
jgi:phage terminase large subunit GpA-like protein